MGGVSSKDEDARSALEISVGEIALHDPRSPTPDISRTPLQGQDAPSQQKITKNVDLTKECFEKYCNDMPANPAMRAVLSEIDPRSPTLDFKRTPLAVLIRNPELMAVYNQMNTSNFLNNSAELDSSKGELEPKNLEDDLQNLSIEVKPVEPLTISIQENLSDVYNKGPVVGLLETNLDYIETDLDTVKRKKKLLNRIKVVNLSEKDPRSPSVGIDRTPIVVAEAPVESALDSKDPEIEIKESKVEIKEIFNHNATLQRKMNETPKTHNSDSLLIYEDDQDSKTTPTPIIKADKNLTPRTPLGPVVENPNSKNISEVISSKSKSRIPVKVKQPMEPRFLAVRNSMTPKNVKKNRRAALDAENTPPKARHARWSQDNSVIL